MNNLIKSSYLLFFFLVCFLYSNPVFSSNFEKDWNHFISSKEASDMAVKISNEGGSYLISKEKVEEIIRLKEIALSEARMVSDRFLKKTHRNMLDYYRNYYQKSLELYIYSMKNNDLDAMRNYHILHSKFIDWFSANKKRFRSP